MTTLSWVEFNARKAQLYVKHLQYVMFHEPDNHKAIEIIEHKISVYNKLALI